MRKINKLYTAFVLLVPILAQYKSFLPGVTLGELSLLIMMPLFCIYNYKVSRNSVQKFLSNPFFWFVYYLLISTLISITTQISFSSFEIFSRSVRLIFYIFCAIIVSKRMFNLYYCMKLYSKLAIFSTIYLFVQVFANRISGVYLKGTIPFLEVANDLYDFERHKLLWQDFYRPSSIFLEPGYYVIFIIPYLIYILFERTGKEKHVYIKAIILTIGLIISTSGQGIILSALIWIIWIAVKTYNFRSERLNIIAIVLATISIFLIPFIYKTEKVQRSISRLFGSSNSSSGTRIFRGFETYLDINPLHQIIGVGYGNVESYLFSNGLINSSYELPNYMNSFAYILVNLGVIGFLMLIFIFIYMSKNLFSFQKVILITFIILSGVGTIFVSATMILYVSIIMTTNITESKNKVMLR